MDWRNLPTDSELHKEIFYRVADHLPEYSFDELYDSRDSIVQEIDLYFGSSGFTVKYGVVDHGAEDAYSHGACALLAYVLHRDYNLPLVVWTSEKEKFGGWSGHVAVQLGKDSYLDIRGISTGESISDYFRRYGGVGKPQPMELSQFLETVVDEEYRANPLGYVDRLEELLTLDYSRILVETYCPQLIKE